MSQLDRWNKAFFSWKNLQKSLFCVSRSLLETYDCDIRKGTLYLGNEAEKFVQELNNSKMN